MERCSAGWAEQLHDITWRHRDLDNTNLHDLFYMSDYFVMENFTVEQADLVMANITVEQAAHALNNYLTTGRASWDEVLK